MAFRIDYCTLSKGIPQVRGGQWAGLSSAIEKLRSGAYRKAGDDSKECYRVGEGYAFVRESNPLIRMHAPSKSGLATMAVAELNLPIDPSFIREFNGKFPEMD
jgi:hypothetical protein